MSRYVLTEEQLDNLQQHIQQLNRIHQAKQDRIKELETYKARTVGSKTAVLLETVHKLEGEVKELRKANKQLTEELNSGKHHSKKVKELEMLLEEERRLREYSETFAKQVELRCAEEALVKDLTTELCQLQRAEIELGSKKIEELQRELESLHYERSSRSSSRSSSHSSSRKGTKQMENAMSRDNLHRHRQLKVIIEELRTYLSDLQDEVESKPVRTKEEEARVKEVEKWLTEIGYLMADVNHIESMRKDLKQLRNEIEYRRRSSAEKRN